MGAHISLSIACMEFRKVLEQTKSGRPVSRVRRRKHCAPARIFRRLSAGGIDAKWPRRVIGIPGDCHARQSICYADCRLQITLVPSDLEERDQLRAEAARLVGLQVSLSCPHVAIVDA